MPAKSMHVHIPVTQFSFKKPTQVIRLQGAGKAVDASGPKEKTAHNANATAHGFECQEADAHAEKEENVKK